MERNVLSRAAEYINQQRKKKRWTNVVSVLAAVVVFCTTYALILPAITLETDVFCGREEHTHGADCYGQVLTCTLPEGEAHVHTEACYQTERTLVCTLKESQGHTHTADCQRTETLLTCTSTEEGHVHGEGCYTTTTTYVCGLEESSGHTHTDACWQETRILVCTQSTEVPQGGHVHNEDCYGPSREPTCGREEHQHDDACYADKTADLESAAYWEKTFADVTLTGDYPADVLAIAETQLGYTESSINYITNDEGRKLGYSRYGAWYGDPYGDWCAMFVSFCLHYGGVPAEAFPREASCQRWIEDLTDLDLYREAESYIPTPGDLIFFNWDSEPDSDHVGIVQEVTLDESGAVTQIKTIEGNTSNQVKIKTYLPTDESVMGYGELPQGKSLEETSPEDTPETEEESTFEEPEESEEPENEAEVEEETSDNGFVSWESLLEAVKEADVSNSPEVYIFARDKEDAPAVFSVRDMRSRSVMMFALENRASEEEFTDLMDYLVDNGGQYALTLTDTNNAVLPKDNNGNYVVTADTVYKLSINMGAPNGILPGKYQYQLPNGLTVHGGEGFFELDGETVGSWTVTDTGLIIFDFNDKMKYKTDVKIPAIMGVEFGETFELIDFDKQITVTVNPPPAPEKRTDLSKWVEQPQDGTVDKIHWKIKIIGRSESKIPGSTITDTILTASGQHFYDDADKASGLTFGADAPEGVWHEWTVLSDDANLTWDEDSWSYTIPDEVNCKYCGPIKLGSDGWTYYITYTSTPIETGIFGTLTYANNVIVDGESYNAWFDVKRGESLADINKTGVFQGDANGGKFVWQINATIPGRETAQRSLRWHIHDALGIEGVETQIINDIGSGKVTATNNGITYGVPEVMSAGKDDLFAYSFDSNTGDIVLFSRCTCSSEENCAIWWPNAYPGEKCGTHSWNTGYTHCECWDVKGETTFTFTYETPASALIDQYGGVGNKLQNSAQLQYMESGANAPIIGADRDVAEVTIPGVFQKNLTEDPDKYNGYTASYQIAVNEAKLDPGESFVIRDEMTTTLAYVSDSLVITTEDANGKITTLKEGVDYTVSYDGTGTINSVDQDNKQPVHLLEITIKNPKPVMYILNYDAALYIPEDHVGGVTVNNVAYVTLWGKNFTDDSEKKTYTDISISGETYTVEINKKSASTNGPLSGATFGLYRPNGSRITYGTTDENGQLSFMTDITAGIILVGHVPYYIQEIQAPDGYITDGTKHWFYFCHNTTGTCTSCQAMDLSAYQNIKKVPENVVTYELTNQLGTYELPESGGAGTNGYTFGGLLLMAGAGFLLYRKTRNGREVKSSS